MSEETNEVTPAPEAEEQAVDVKDMDPKDLKQLAIDIVDGKVFGSWDMRNIEDIGMVFMVLMLMKKAPKNAAHVYEYLSEAGPRSVNGMPIFMSCRFLTQSDAEKLYPMLKQLQQMKADFLESSDIKEEGKCQNDQPSETSTSSSASSDTSTT